MLILETEGNSTAYTPGSSIRGKCGWRLPAAPREAAIRLFWYTEGRGTQDLGVVGEEILPVQAAVQEQAFNFTLPEGPYSFSGTLISLRWALELVLDRGREVARVDLLVSPWETEVVVAPFEGEPR